MYEKTIHCAGAYFTFYDNYSLYEISVFINIDIQSTRWGPIGLVLSVLS